VRRHNLFAETKPGTEKKAKNQGRPSARHVDNGAAGEIDRTDPGIGIPDAIHQAINAPNHMG